MLNALSSLKRYPDADPNRIGMWGHSMGGQLTLRSMVVSKDIKAGVIWGGVVAPYPDLLSKWRRTGGAPPPSLASSWRQAFTSEYGSPQENPRFWNAISPNSYVADLSGPVQLHHSVTDEEVPISFSQTLSAEILQAGKTVELYEYPGDDHNISHSFWLAMQRSIAFFDRYLKAG